MFINTTTASTTRVFDSNLSTRSAAGVELSMGEINQVGGGLSRENEDRVAGFMTYYGMRGSGALIGFALGGPGGAIAGALIGMGAAYWIRHLN